MELDGRAAEVTICWPLTPALPSAAMPEVGSDKSKVGKPIRSNREHCHDTYIDTQFSRALSCIGKDRVGGWRRRY